MYRLILYAIVMLQFAGCYKTAPFWQENAEAGVVDSDTDTHMDMDVDAGNDSDTIADTDMDTEVDTEIDTEPDTDIDTGIDADTDVNTDSEIDTGIDGEGEPCLADILSIAFPTGVCKRPGSTCEGSYISYLSSLGIAWSSNCPDGLDCCIDTDQCDIQGAAVGDIIPGLSAACYAGPCPTQDFLALLQGGCPSNKPNCCVKGYYPFGDLGL
ncbi:MAG: hypothetical protein GY847_12210 [Proteobacteria bacterium]|nr:hypothetical protein [Pseudomonadota bacterium]